MRHADAAIDGAAQQHRVASASVPMVSRPSSSHASIIVACAAVQLAAPFLSPSSSTTLMSVTPSNKNKRRNDEQVTPKDDVAAAAAAVNAAARSPHASPSVSKSAKRSHGASHKKHASRATRDESAAEAAASAMASRPSLSTSSPPPTSCVLLRSTNSFTGMIIDDDTDVDDGTDIGIDHAADAIVASVANSGTVARTPFVSRAPSTPAPHPSSSLAMLPSPTTSMATSASGGHIASQPRRSLSTTVVRTLFTNADGHLDVAPLKARCSSSAAASMADAAASTRLTLAPPIASSDSVSAPTTASAAAPPSAVEPQHL